jgi:hypothetical protein
MIQSAAPSTSNYARDTIQGTPGRANPKLNSVQLCPSFQELRVTIKTANNDSKKPTFNFETEGVYVCPNKNRR